ncbi:MAG: APC family permease [Sphingomicrobium sp.]|nr:amino acid permease [Sphingomonadales bacterium]
MSTAPAFVPPPLSSRQQMGVPMTVAFVVGTMIGSGIFLLPVTLAPLGWNAIIGWGISGLGAIAIAFALARLTSRGSGGIQAYVERSFGATTAYLVTWALWCSNAAASAALGIATASAVAWMAPSIGSGVPFIAIAVGSVVLLQAVNAMGARASGGMAVVTTAIKILPLLAVLVAAASRGAEGSLQPLAAAPLTMAGIGSAVALTLFALTGFENGTAPVDKVRNPARTLPIAIFGGTSFVALLYLFSSYAVLSLLPAAVVERSSAPFADAVGFMWGNGAAVGVAVAVAIAAFGALNAMILATGELGYSLALRGDFPRLFARTHGANTPIIAQVLGSGFAILLILANASRTTANLFSFVILLSTASVLLLYLVGALAAWKENPSSAARSVIVVALGFIAFAFWGAGAEADLWSLVLLAIGYALRLLMHRLNSPVSSPAVEAAPAAPRGPAA